jgi:hypothetical protein
MIGARKFGPIKLNREQSVNNFSRSTSDRSRGDVRNRGSTGHQSAATLWVLTSTRRLFETHRKRNHSFTTNSLVLFNGS